MQNDTILCGRRGSPNAVTTKDYSDWAKEPDSGWSRKPEFIRRRLYERYVDPVRALDLYPETKDKKNGFYIMAVSCLLIETLVAHWRGWETTEASKKVKGKSGKAFRLFFRTQPRFRCFHNTKFYKNVRCGILHQGETTGGWSILRTGPLFDGKNTINAKRFHDQLAFAVDDYVNALRNGPNAQHLRVLFEKKMEAVIRNCKEI